MKCIWTDPLVLAVLQPYGVVGHTQQCDDEVDQSKDAVEPQKVVPERHEHTKKTAAVISATALSLIAALLGYFKASDITGYV